MAEGRTERRGQARSPMISLPFADALGAARRTAPPVDAGRSTTEGEGRQRSLGSGEIGSTTPGTLTPFAVRLRAADHHRGVGMIGSEAVDAQSQLAVIEGRSVPVSSAAKISGWGRLARVASPSGSESRRKRSPATRVVLPRRCARRAAWGLRV